MLRLIIAEKPSVARDLAQVLQIRGRGEGFWQSPTVWISWCIGHVAELCEPQAYDPAWKAWSAATLPMLPEAFKLQPAASSRAQFAVLKRLLRSKEVGEVVNACDAGREGELIFRLAAELAGCRKPVRRLWLSALTDGAIRKALANLRPQADYDALADAARCRSEADWLVGLNATRALTVHHRRSGGGTLYTVGRVQTPTLAMLVQREQEIERFVPEPYWQVLAEFQAQAGPYPGTYTQGKQDRLPTAEAAESVRRAVEHQTGQVTQVEHKDQVEAPPLLYDLTSLQRQANQRYGLSAADTLAAAQTLYEKHKLLTYPRTDANHLTEDMRPTLPDVLRSLNQGTYAPFVEPLLAAPALRAGPRVICDREVGDHHAIIPTGRSAEAAQLTPRERQVFDLVARRFIAVFCLPAIFALTRAETQVGEHTFVSRGRTCKQAGWQAVDPPWRAPAKPRPGGQPGQGPAAAHGVLDVLLPDLRRGEAAPVRKVQSREGKTKPPPRYNEASLLGAMERAGSQLEAAELRRAMKDSGLGTPATRASIIEGLQRRQFLRREGKQLVPTDQGRALIGALPVHSLKSPELTGQWEARLGEVARGHLQRAVFMQEVRAYVRQCVGDIFGGARGPAPSPAPTSSAPAGPAGLAGPAGPTGLAGPAPQEFCPLCKAGRLVRGRRTWGCSRWRQGCDYTYAGVAHGGE